MTRQVMSLRLPNIPDEIANRFGNSLPNAVNNLATKITQSVNQNEMRQVLYREATMNNWNNQYFMNLAELTRLLVAAHLGYNEQYKQSTYNLNAEVDNILEQIVEFAATDIVMSYPEFNYKLNDGNAFTRADNIIKYVLNEINVASSKLSNYLSYIRGSVTTLPNAPLTVPVGNPINNAYNKQSTIQQNQSMMLNNQVSSASRYNTSKVVEPSNFIGNNPGGYDRDKKPTEEINENLYANRTSFSNKLLTTKDWKPTLNNPYLTLLTNDYERTFERINGVIVERYNKKGTATVDRRAHCIMGDVPVDTPTRVSTVNKLTDQHFGALRERVPEVRQAKINEFVDTGYVLVDTLESGIVGLKMKMLTNNKDNKRNDYHRYNLLVAKCYPDKYDYNNYMEDLSSCSSFVTMANTLNMYIDQAKSLRDKTDEDKTRLMMFLSGINIRLTKFINTFLSTGLGIDVHIDSFMMDAGTLEDYLQTNFGSTYSGAYRDFEFTTSQSILKTSVDKATLDSNLKEEGMDEICINYIPEVYTVSFVNLFLSELGLEKMETNRPYAIMRDKSPMLYNIAASIFKDTTTAEGIQIMDASKHLIVTVDDQHLYINKSYLGRDLFVVTIEDK